MIAPLSDGNALLMEWPPVRCVGCGRMVAMLIHYRVGPKGRRTLCLDCPPPGTKGAGK